MAPYLAGELRAIARDVFWASSLVALADTVADLSWVEPTTALLSLFEPYVDQWDWVGPTSQGPLARPAARLLSLAGDHARADEIFARALRSSSSASAPVYEAHTYLDWGRAQCARSSADNRLKGHDMEPDGWLRAVDWSWSSSSRARISPGTLHDPGCPTSALKKICVSPSGARRSTLHH